MKNLSDGIEVERNTYKHGDWVALCDRCGFRFYASQLRLEWTGLRVCHGGGTNNCWEPRHPQDFVRAKRDRQMPKWVRPDNDGIDVSVGSGNEISADDL